ncbi:hypothetical protein FACS1894201_02610 [Bacteroidia bacterium]|nr:hypothetical protein FACS1894201_02610 [Bacteroidia bacterium]
MLEWIFILQAKNVPKLRKNLLTINKIFVNKNEYYAKSAVNTSINNLSTRSVDKLSAINPSKFSIFAVQYKNTT